MPPKAKASSPRKEEPVEPAGPTPPTAAEVEAALRKEFQQDYRILSEGEDIVLGLVDNIVSNSTDLYIKRNYDALAVNYTVLAAWEDMMSVVETSLVAHDRGQSQHWHSLKAPAGPSSVSAEEGMVLSVEGSFVGSTSEGRITPEHTPSTSSLSNSPVASTPTASSASHAPRNLPAKRRNTSTGSTRPKRPSASPNTAALAPKRSVTPPTTAPTSTAPSPTLAPTFSPSKEYEKRWIAGAAPAPIHSDEHSRHSMIMRSQLEGKDLSALKDVGEGKEANASTSGRRQNRRINATNTSMGSSSRPDSGATSSDREKTPNLNTLRRPHRKSVMGNQSRTPRDNSLERPSETPIKDVVLSAEDAALQEEVSQQRQRRQELIDLREKLTKQMADKQASQKGFVVDSRLGTVVPLLNPDGVAKKPETTRFNVPAPPPVEQQPAEMPKNPPPAHSARGVRRLNTAPAGASRAKDDQFFTAESGGVAMVVEVPLQPGVGIQDADGSKRNEYQQPKSKLSRTEFKKMLQQHHVSAQLEANGLGPQQPAPDSQAPSSKATAPQPHAPAPGSGQKTPPGSAAPGGKAAAGGPGVLPDNHPGGKQRPQTQGGKRPATLSKDPAAPKVRPPRSAGSSTPHAVKRLHPDRSHPPKVTHRSHPQSPRSVRPITRGELNQRLAEVKTAVDVFSPIRSRVQPNVREGEDDILSNMSSVDESPNY